MDLRLTTDLPKSQEYEEPATLEERVAQSAKLASGFGFYTYTSADREGSNVTYIGEWLNYKRHGKGVLRNHKEKWEYRGTFTSNQIDGFGQYSWKSGDTYTGWFN